MNQNSYGSGDKQKSTTGRSEDVQRVLIELLNSQKPKISPNAQTRMLNTKITDKDVNFFKAPNEVIKIHQYRIDPTIRDILGRLQYASSPEGGTPLSRQYLRAISSDNQDGTTSTTTSQTRYGGAGISQVSQPRTLPSIEQQLSSTAPNLGVNGSNISRSRASSFNSDGGRRPGSPLDIESLLSHVPSLQLTRTSAPLGSPLNGTANLAINRSIPQPLQQIQQQQQQQPGGNNTNLVGELVDRIKNMDSGQQQNLISGIAQMLVGTLSNSGQNQSGTQQQPPQSQPQQTIAQPATTATPYSLQNPISGHRSSVSADFRSPYPMNGQPAFKIQKTAGAVGTVQPSTTQFILESPSSNGMMRSYSTGTSSVGTNKRYGGATNVYESTTRYRNGRKRNPKSEKRQFVCAKCGSSFKRSSDLKRHEKIHLAVMPNICPLCKKGFARKDALKRHIDTLTCRRNREKMLRSMREKKKEKEARSKAL